MVRFGCRGISEIRAWLVFAGLVLDAGTPEHEQQRAGQASPARPSLTRAATRTGQRQSGRCTVTTILQNLLPAGGPKYPSACRGITEPPAFQDPCSN